MRFLNAVKLEKGDVVALEGAPIYLSDKPGPAHHHAGVVMRDVYTALLEKGCVPQHYLLLDEYNGDEQPGTRELYQANVTVPPTHTVLESEMCEPGLELLGLIPQKRLHRGGNTGELRKLRVPASYNYTAPLLVRNSGKPACALLDGAFQRGKVADLNIVIHPVWMDVQGERVNFREQQASVLAVLSAVRTQKARHPHLPWKRGMLHVWLGDDGEIVDVIWSRNKGSNIKTVPLRRY